MFTVNPSTTISNALQSNVAVNTMIGLLYTLGLCMSVAILNTALFTMISTFTTIGSAFSILDTVMKGLFLIFTFSSLAVILCEAGPSICPGARTLFKKYWKYEGYSKTESPFPNLDASVQDTSSLRNELNKHLAGPAQNTVNTTRADELADENLGSENLEESYMFEDVDGNESVSPPYLYGSPERRCDQRLGE